MPIHSTPRLTGICHGGRAAPVSWLHSHHLVLLSAQGDSGEMGFPGVAGLFGPKVQCSFLCLLVLIHLWIHS